MTGVGVSGEKFSPDYWLKRGYVYWLSLFSKCVLSTTSQPGFLISLTLVVGN